MGLKPYRHSVIYFSAPWSGEEEQMKGVDFGPAPAYQDKIVLKCLFGCPGISSGGDPFDPRRPVIPLDLKKKIDWELLLKITEITEFLAYTKDGFMVSCCDATDEQIKFCLEKVSKEEWDNTTFRVLGRNCMDFTRAAEKACCLDPAPLRLP